MIYMAALKEKKSENASKEFFSSTKKKKKKKICGKRYYCPDSSFNTVARK